MTEQKERNREMIETIKDKTGEKHNHQKLTINRVPDEAVGKLQDISYELFAGDYGATLAYLVELHKVRNQFLESLETTQKEVKQVRAEVGRLNEKIEQQNNDDNGSKVDTIG